MRARDRLLILILISNIKFLVQHESIIQCLPMSTPKFGTFYIFFLHQPNLWYVVPENTIE